MSEEPEFFTYTREEFLDEFVHPDDRPALEEARQKRVLQVRAEYLTEMRKSLFGNSWLWQDRQPGQGARDAGHAQRGLAPLTQRYMLLL
jgi:hypothetical protein